MQQRASNDSSKALLLTGASGGIGSAIAKFATQAGFSVVLCCHRNISAAQALCEFITKNGGVASVLQVNLSDPAACGRIVDDTVTRYGRLDVLVNNAGFLNQQPFENIPLEEWDFTFAVNLRAPFLLAQAAFPVMRQNGGGRIINIASSGGQLGGPLAPHYAASKAGLICLTKSLARLGAADNIITHAVSPGLITTEMTEAEVRSEAGREKMKNIPLGRPGTAEEVAEVVLLAAQGKMDYATGQTINLNGGLYMG
jgi:acetoacetyl-CoA reductase/3-oxoacyl-[acyl-carrier protein] reductase